MINENRNGNGVITWRVIGVAGWVVVWALMWAGLNDISSRVRKLEESQALIQGELQILIRDQKSAKLPPLNKKTIVESAGCISKPNL